MLGERKPKANTNLFAHYGSRKKQQLSPRDFGAKAQDRLGSQVQGLGLPQPTQFIVVPKDVMSTDAVLLELSNERRTLAWQLRLAKRAWWVVLHRAEGVFGKWRRRARMEIERISARVYESVRRVEIEDWSEDMTVIAESPPEFPIRQRRPSVV